ncbi:hypothetical protein B0H17DRAFT_1216425 [Mycena rosella]|uniref:Uncharacterized protein n=1 Tax=Mycena rosella TaxID=1033263 RepID=A0AAD7C9D1_MYCRO|nr:hypothetical protein B0H17DRAFT_1216425 [Mycena rosella]
MRLEAIPSNLWIEYAMDGLLRIVRKLGMLVARVADCRNSDCLPHVRILSSRAAQVLICCVSAATPGLVAAQACVDDIYRPGARCCITRPNAGGDPSDRMMRPTLSLVSADADDSRILQLACSTDRPPHLCGPPEAHAFLPLRTSPLPPQPHCPTRTLRDLQATRSYCASLHTERPPSITVHKPQSVLLKAQKSGIYEPATWSAIRTRGSSSRRKRSSVKLSPVLPLMPPPLLEALQPHILQSLPPVLVRPQRHLHDPEKHCARAASASCHDGTISALQTGRSSTKAPARTYGRRTSVPHTSTTA